jgi:hypothetical protein
MDDRNKAEGKGETASGREARLGEALRANLKRRKALKQTAAPSEPGK